MEPKWKQKNGRNKKKIKQKLKLKEVNEEKEKKEKEKERIINLTFTARSCGYQNWSGCNGVQVAVPIKRVWYPGVNQAAIAHNRPTDIFAVINYQLLIGKHIGFGWKLVQDSWLVSSTEF